MKRSVALAAGLAVLILLVGSVYVVLPLLRGSGGQGGSTTTSGGSISSTTSGSSQAAVSTIEKRIDWTTYHANNERTGYKDVSNFTSVTKGWTSPTLDGLVFAEPLEFHGHVFVATENNSVYALSSNDGSVAWRTNLGPPVLGKSLPCGDVGPVTGITGTPVIDPSTEMIYVVSFSAMHHTLSALRVATGAVAFQRSATPPGFDDTVQEERAALTLANGMVYIAYGGLTGDCGQYHGWVVGLPANGTGSMDYYQVPTSREGGIWGPAGATVDQSGNVYVTTGNSASVSNSNFEYGDSVIKLSPSLKVEGYFAPSDWVKLNQNDADLGSLGPSIVGPGTIFQIGKEGVGYLLNTSQLGGVGGQVFSTPVCSESFGGTAFVSPLIFVPCVDGLFELKVANGTFSTFLVVSGFSAGPPIVTGGVVWTVNADKAILYGLSTTTGHEAYSFPLGSVAHSPCFSPTPAAGDGQVFVAAADKVLSFVLG